MLRSTRSVAASKPTRQDSINAGDLSSFPDCVDHNIEGGGEFGNHSGPGAQGFRGLRVNFGVYVAGRPPLLGCRFAREVFGLGFFFALISVPSGIRPKWRCLRPSVISPRLRSAPRIFNRYV